MHPMHVPLSLYIHLPWCIRKCPYCDFNSHQLQTQIPEQAYVNALLTDLKQDVVKVGDRQIESIFLGGGTPSLFSGESIAALLAGVAEQVKLADDVEITLEANPGTVEQQYFNEYQIAGVNRLSLGVQSFQDQQLQQLGRIHDKEQAQAAVERAAMFDRVNIDLMYGLPGQTVTDALDDLRHAIALGVGHISWYQLTIEPNTIFYKKRPVLPSDVVVEEMEMKGRQLLAEAGLRQYEVSAYSKQGVHCRHNHNYWLFGDYVGVGAGAHGKITDVNHGTITRSRKVRQPQPYLQGKHDYLAEHKVIPTIEVPFEFMLNAARLYEPIKFSLFTERTGLFQEALHPVLIQAQAKQFMEYDEEAMWVTERGRRYLDNLVGMFFC